MKKRPARGRQENASENVLPINGAPWEFCVQPWVLSSCPYPCMNPASCLLQPCQHSSRCAFRF